MEGNGDAKAALLGSQPVCWSCNAAGAIDIKRWFMGIITPDFQTEEARQRCGSGFDDNRQVMPEENERRMEEVYRVMRRNSSRLNSAPTTMKPVVGVISRVFSRMNPGGVRSCTAALVATALGSGSLGLPYAFSLVGVGLGLATMTFAGFASALSLQILMVAARYTGTTTYSGILQLALGTPKAALIMDLILLFNGAGACAACLIFEGDFWPPVLSSPPFAEGLPVTRGIAIVGAALLAWPLAIPNEISGLRYVAVMVPVALLVTIFIVSWDAPTFHELRRDSGDHVKWWDFKLSNWLQATAIMVNAFSSHMNAIPAANELESPSIARIVKATVHANLTVFVMLSGLGIAGYASWASVTQGDFILSYPDDKIEFWVCRLFLAVLVFLVLPVSLFPTAKSAAQLSMALIWGPGQEVGPKAHALSVTVVLAVCTGVALAVRDVAAVLGVIGGLLAASIMFWFPAFIFRILLWPTQPKYCRWPVLLSLLFFGVAGWSSVAMKFF